MVDVGESLLQNWQNTASFPFGRNMLAPIWNTFGMFRRSDLIWSTLEAEVGNPQGLQRLA
jgi:hypothetical protein